MPPDSGPRDAEFIDTVVSSVTGLIGATHRGDRMRFIGELSLLLTAIIKHNKTLGDRPGDEPLRRAVAR